MPVPQKSVGGGGFIKLMLNSKLENAQKNIYANKIRSRVKSSHTRYLSFDNNYQPAAKTQVNIADSLTNTKYSSAQQKHSHLN